MYELDENICFIPQGPNMVDFHWERYMSLTHKQRFTNQQTIGTEIQEQKVMRKRDTKRSKVWLRQILRKRLWRYERHLERAVQCPHWVSNLTMEARQTQTLCTSPQSGLLHQICWTLNLMYEKQANYIVFAWFSVKRFPRKPFRSKALSAIASKDYVGCVIRIGLVPSNRYL